MPELPEVETTIRGLSPIINCTITNIKIHTYKLRLLIPKNLSKIHGSIKINYIKRRGKYILLYLSNKFILVIHLGMSGRLRLINNNRFRKQKHDHLTLRTNQDHCLIFNDPRKFGFVDYGKIDAIYKKKYLLNLGEEALGSKLSVKYLFTKINKSRVPIKQILLDQRIIAGIGNIYASEILFDARISPIIPCNLLTKKDIKTIITSIKKILTKAINAGGSTLKNYVSTDGTIGNFQNNFRVYNRLGKKISGHSIIKIIQYGRSTYYCPGIQKNK